jgi:galactoside O-acetyltransferase
MKNKLDPGWYTEDDLREMGFANVGENIKVSKNCMMVGEDKIHIGSNVRIDAFTTIVTGKEKIYIGDYSHIACGVHLSGTYGFVSEGYNIIAAGSKIYSGVDDYTGPYLITAPNISEKNVNIKHGVITMEKYSILGCNCVVFPDVTLHEGSAMGACSFTNKSLDPWNVYLGVPAKKIKKREKFSGSI